VVLHMACAHLSVTCTGILGRTDVATLVPFAPSTCLRFTSKWGRQCGLKLFQVRGAHSGQIFASRKSESQLDSSQVSVCLQPDHFEMKGNSKLSRLKETMVTVFSDRNDLMPHDFLRPSHN
jgi:hypothetical protein